LLGDELTFAGLNIVSIRFAEVGKPGEEPLDLIEGAGNVAIVSIPDVKH
jgi:hypothetical protein